MTRRAGLRPLLVLGLDGATFDLIEPLAREGRLPNLASWMAEGSRARLESTVPPMSFPAWSTFLTGLGPGAHGLFDFTQKVAGAYRVRFTNATDRAGSTLLARVARAGGRVLCLGVPATFPPEPVPGLVVAGFDAPVSTGSDAARASDPALYRRVAARTGPWASADLDERATAPGWHERALDVLLARVARKRDFALEALAELRRAGAPPDLVCVVFSESDTVAHHFWRDHDPRSPRRDPGAGARRRGAVASVYEALDAACGELRQGFGRDAACVVLSDHGAGGAARHVVHLGRRLAECGFLRRATAPRRLARDALARSARDLALALAPPRLAEAAFRRARGAASAVESAARFGGVDWARTAAFSEEANTRAARRKGRSPRPTTSACGAR
jgi:predicted AlkP superfamily phosphohydrolase/phosphomutase